MNPLPLPIRVAAGLVATAVEQARDLPRQIIELPVTAVSQTLQASMRVQQKVTELAIKGDRILSVLHPVEEKPSWATFDDDEPASPPHTNGFAPVTTLRPVAEPAAEAEPETEADASPTEEPPVDRIDAVADLDEVADAEALALIEDAIDEEGSAGMPDVELAPVDEPQDDLPPALPDYPRLTIPQLRGKLRFLVLADLHGLLVWETAHENRPPFVTMLTNRIATVSAT